MKWTIAAATLLLALAPTSAIAQQPSALGPDQKMYIAYHACMMQAAMKSSHSTARDDEVYALAHRACAGVRAEAMAVGREFPELIAALDAADAEKQANFPNWIKGVRERRAKFEAGTVPPRANP